MAYDNPGPAAAPSPMGDMGAEMPMRDKGETTEGGVLHIGAAELPKGMKLNKGDIVEFKVIGDQDADGDWPIEYNYGEEGKEGESGAGQEEEGTAWEDDFRKSMSARAGQEEAGSEGPQ